MPYYCTVPRCTSMAGKAKNVSFHQFPRDEELAKLWNNILKRGKPYTKYSKVCSLHFTPEDYTITSVGKNKGQWRTLRKDAVPSQNLPSESPTPYQRKQWGSWSHNAPANVLEPSIQQQVAQAIYMQTMLAMQAAGTAEVPTLPHSNGLPQLPASNDPPFAHASNTTETDILKGKQTNTNEKSTSYKCTECSKCFKDPDVFILHKRSHIKNEKNEKENFNLNLTLQANPILANLLKTNSENSNIFDSNAISVESLLMTALAANMEGYMRSFTSMIKNDDRGSFGHERGDFSPDRGGLSHNGGDLSHDRGNLSHDRGSYGQSNQDLSNIDSYIENRENSLQRGVLSHEMGLENDRGMLNGDICEINHDRESINLDRGTDHMENISDTNLIRDRITEIYRNNDTGSDRNIRYYENDGEHNDRGVTNDDRCLINDDIAMINDGSGMINNDRGMINDDRGTINDDRGMINDDGGVTNDDTGYNGDIGITNDDSQSSEEPICDSDLNESIDSNQLVIDETA